MQYANFVGFTPVISAISDIKNARNLGYTFIAQDDSTVKHPSLMYFRCKNQAVADIYIAEQLREDIQVAIVNYIISNNPSYINNEIVNLTVVANQVINIYKSRNLIESASFTIPTKDLQLNADIAIGKLSNVKTNINLNGAVWWIEGDVSYQY